MTRDYEGKRAKENLLNILKDQKIVARNAHCLVKYKINQMGFSSLLRQSFNTVCFTETPLTQIKQLTAEIKDRKIQLKPYGLVFWKEKLFDKGASPAIYINAKGTPIKEFILDEFDRVFEDVRQLKELKKTEKEHYKSIVHYYSLINVVSDEHDFLWEREWRHHGDFYFDYTDVVAIIAENPQYFEKYCERNLDYNQLEDIEKIPIINPDWNYEEVIEQLAITIWDKLQNVRRT
ncbi:hypothetical protein [Fischerella sp. PCC 9605]|uniref:hypothetical protein n=1 Tax=Fischerella sp. PCC 9605 TaxID=1173024 RepID=UPI0012DCFB92|nr:hypothetical protein [Fischerella sp. PCC 9605]